MNLSLHKLQHRFKKALQTEVRLSKDPLLALETPLVPFKTRIGIYQYAYYARIVEALESDFPRLRKRLGKKRLKELLKQYLKQHPSRFASLSEVGSGLPGFLKEQRKLPNRLKLSELARFEWLYHRAGMSRIETVRHEAIPQRLVRTSHTLLFQTKVKPHPPQVIWRTLEGTKVKRVPKAHADLLEYLGKPKTLGQLATFVARLNFSQAEAKHLFQTIARHGWVTAREN